MFVVSAELSDNHNSATRLCTSMTHTAATSTSLELEEVHLKLMLECG